MDARDDVPGVGDNQGRGSLANPQRARELGVVLDVDLAVGDHALVIFHCAAQYASHSEAVGTVGAGELQQGKPRARIQQIQGDFWRKPGGSLTRHSALSDLPDKPEQGGAD